MAKLGKEKFKDNGFHERVRSTFSGDVELYLYYDTTNHYFYFDHSEMAKYFKDDMQFSDVFKGCDSREKAIGVITTMLSKDAIEKRMLEIELNMPEDLYKIPNPESSPAEDNNIYNIVSANIINTDFPEYLQNMLRNSHMYSARGFSVSFKRVMKITNRDKSVYSECNENWSYNKRSIKAGGSNLIEWTMERELFLIDLQSKMDELCKRTLDFFNAKDLNELSERMSSGTKLLGNGN